jgi:hypothetical protein
MASIRFAAIGQTAAEQLAAALQAVEADDWPRAETCALISIAASLYRLQAQPVPANHPLAAVPADPLDLDPADPPESETERYWREQDEDDKRGRQHPSRGRRDPD